VGGPVDDARDVAYEPAEGPIREAGPEWDVLVDVPVVEVAIQPVDEPAAAAEHDRSVDHLRHLDLHPRPPRLHDEVVPGRAEPDGLPERKCEPAVEEDAGLRRAQAADFEAGDPDARRDQVGPATVPEVRVRAAGRKGHTPQREQDPPGEEESTAHALGIFIPRPGRRATSLASFSVHYQFVDCRWELGSPGRGRELYLAGHVPGASFLDVDDDLSDLSVEGRGRHPLPSAERFAAAASRAGIGPGVLVVAYGTQGGAERLWWLLRHFGHDDCAVLLGALEAWAGPLRPGEEEVEPMVFEPREREGDTIQAGELMRRLGDPSLVLADARPAERWRGEPNPIDDPPGRIPGALNAPWADPVPELPPGELVAYCGSGVTACVTLHREFMRGRAGRLYPGSWSEWSTRGLPLERDA